MGTIKNKIAKRKIHWTQEEDEIIKDSFGKIMTVPELAIKLNLSKTQIYRRAKTLGLKVDIEWVKECSRKNMEKDNHPAKLHWKKKGCVALNKGKKQVEYMSPEAIERTKKTQFQKGQKGWNHKPVGYECLRDDGYCWIKIQEPKKFKLKQRLVWEMNHGAIPPGWNVQFKDGNRQNTDINNLYIISKKEQMRQNSIQNYPEEVRVSLQALGRLNSHINKQLKKQQNEQESN